MNRSPQKNGFGIVVLAIALQVLVLVQMWLTAPIIARAMGPTAYLFAVVMTLLTTAIVLIILDDEALWQKSPRAEAVRLARGGYSPPELRRH